IHLREEIARLVGGESTSLDAIQRLCERGRAWGYQPEKDRLEKTLAEALLQTLEEIQPQADLTPITVPADGLLSPAALLGLVPDLWQVQNRFLKAYLWLAESQVVDAPLQVAFAKLARDLKISQSP